MKALLLIIALLLMVGQSYAAESEDLIAEQAEIHKAYVESDNQTRSEYDACVKENEKHEIMEERNCVNEVLGDIY